MYKNDYELFHVVPKVEFSRVNSRSDVSTANPYFFGMNPIISAPMKGISGENLVIEMGKNNCLGILHRFDSKEKRKEMIVNIGRSDVRFGVAVGLNNWDEEFEIADFAVKNGSKVICLDIANGYLSKIEQPVKMLRQSFPEIFIMVGNTVTYANALVLENYGADMVRVGIGGGSLCSTRKATSIGRNTLIALKEMANLDAFKIADGGISEPGYAVKSFVAGADFVMLGKSLAQSEEADHDGKIYGMASLKNHQLNNKEVKSIEGYEENVTGERKPLKEILDEFLWGIKSACTYCGCDTYLDLQNKAYLEDIYGNRILGEYNG